MSATSTPAAPSSTLMPNTGANPNKLPSRREHYEKPSVKRKRKEAKRKKNARTPQG